MTREEELKYREVRNVRILEVGDGFRTLCECPTGGEKLSEFDEFNYCPNCGQRLDWCMLYD